MNSLRFKVFGLKLLAIGYWLLAISCNNKPKDQIAENEYYVCSMDPQVMEKQMGNCPICKMPLSKTIVDKNDLHVIKLSDEQLKLANIQTDIVHYSGIGREQILTGVFSVNQSNTEQISARINGRIEKLYYKIIGEKIREGEPVYDLYSRELLLAQEEYLIAYEKTVTLTNFINKSLDMVRSAKNKLLLWGMTDKQIAELEKTKKAQITLPVYSTSSGIITEIPLKEGDYVKEGTKIYKLADLTSLWVEAQLYTGELGYLEQGKKVEIVAQAFSQETIEGVITFANPELQGESKINLVRIEVDNSKMLYKPGMQAYVKLKSEERKAIELPVDAVIQNAVHSIVWVQNKKGSFEPRMVKLGIQSKDKIEIISGLNEGEMVVISGAYAVNSEYIFKRGAMPMENMKGMKM